MSVLWIYHSDILLYKVIGEVWGNTISAATKKCTNISTEHRILKDSQLFYWSLTVQRQLRKNLSRWAVSSDIFFLIAFQISQKIVSIFLAVRTVCFPVKNLALVLFFSSKLWIKVHYKILSLQSNEILSSKRKGNLVSNRLGGHWMKFDGGTGCRVKVRNICYCFLIPFLLYFNAIINDKCCRYSLFSKVQ